MTVSAAMPFPNKYFLPLAVGLAIIPGAAAAAVEDQQLWLTSAATVDLGDDLRVSEEMIVRFGNAQNGLYEIENNLLLGYRLSEKVTVWAGYTHDPLYSAGHFTRMEHRAREQVTADNVARLANGAISLRLRMEQRWREGQAGTGWRLRPFVRYALPIGRDGGPALILSHESFINLSRTDFQAATGFDRMRNNATVRFPLSKKLSAEIGYLNQYAVLRRRPDRMDHAGIASLSLSL